MFNFKKVDLASLPLLLRAFDSYKGRICDYSAGNAVFWRDHFGISYHLSDDSLILHYSNMGKRECFSYPLSSDPDREIRNLLSECENELVLTCLTKEEIVHVKESIEVSEVLHSENYDDYLYNAEEMTSLAGRKYSGQRNHINKFKKLYPEGRFEVITKENAHIAKDFCNRYFENLKKETDVSDFERTHLPEVFDNWEAYGQLGGMLIVGDTVVGISIGEIVGDTLIVHIEKADISFDGAYPMLTNCFAREFADNERCQFINREEDCGDEGLRISKKSYHPVEMIRKYAVVIKKETC